jgi:hypothetical protein
LDPTTYNVIFEVFVTAKFHVMVFWVEKALYSCKIYPEEGGSMSLRKV